MNYNLLCVLITTGLALLNIYVAIKRKELGNFNWFVAGFCSACAISSLLRLGGI